MIFPAKRLVSGLCYNLATKWQKETKHLVYIHPSETTIGALPNIRTEIPNWRFDRALGLTMRVERFGPTAESDHHGANLYAQARVAVRRCREGANEHFAF